MKKKNAFTLIELIIVMAIMGILIMVGLTSFSSSSQKGRDNRRKSDLRQIATALEAYYSDKGKYPTDNTSGGGSKMMGCGVNATALCNWGDVFSNTSTSPNTIYMVKLPKDPSTKFQYYYVSQSGTNYKLYALLENSQDLDYKAGGYSGTHCEPSGSQVVCTYGIASPNTTP